MTSQQIAEIKKFSINWITKVVSRRKNYQQKLIDVIEDLFPDDLDKWDRWGMLGCKNWDYGEEYVEAGRKYLGCSMSSRLAEIIEESNDYFCLTKKAKNDLVCTIRIATDILISPSGGVIGYTVGDIKKAYDGIIPSRICKLYNKDLNNVNEDSGIWL